MAHAFKEGDTVRRLDGNMIGEVISVRPHNRGAGWFDDKANAITPAGRAVLDANKVKT